MLRITTQSSPPVPEEQQDHEPVNTAPSPPSRVRPAMARVTYGDWSNFIADFYVSGDNALKTRDVLLDEIDD